MIEVEDYSLYGHNRQDLHSRAKAGSGGFGFLVNNHILKQYTISHINKGHDGILSIKLTDKKSDFSFVVFCLYLPPAESIRGRDVIEFFAYVLSELYFYANCDITFAWGDANSRLRNMSDTHPDINGISLGINIDTVKNSHGE